jgi:plastocyanin
MTRIAIVAALATAGAALALTAAAGGRTNVTALRATVGPGFTITLTRNGSRVMRLKPGLYRINVVDRAAIHNFKLEKSGGAFERTLTSVGFKGIRTMTVRLSAGRWEYYCTPHERSMKGHFTVGSGAAGTTTDDHGNDG